MNFSTHFIRVLIPPLQLVEFQWDLGRLSYMSRKFQGLDTQKRSAFSLQSADLGDFTLLQTAAPRQKGAYS